ncbi:ABC multidrug transporter [Purpureocillium lavendulum]|uniref:ABC multidrug transporter n=1 Tax=Purpureocillium lavendulum TaxID=1247861 RepID=A0AB34G7R8_9HYPO|nr:ABC multidrug transporter [Purpureocillium lavendulum]
MSDDKFGPQLPSIFDFTILFEQSILSLLPTCVFLALAPLRVYQLLRRQTVVPTGAQLWLKMKLLVAVYGALQIALLALWCLPSTPKTKTTIPAAIFSIFEAATISVISYSEHRKSIKPAALLDGYLLVSLILSVAPARTYFLRADVPRAIAGVYATGLVAKAALLVLEETRKRGVSGDAAPETIAGVVSRGVFWWLNRLLVTGARNVLGVDDIQAIEPKFDSRQLLSTLERAWEKDSKQGKWALMKTTFLAYKWQFAAGILPRLCFTAFTFTQPFLINSVVRSVGEPAGEHAKDVSASLIGATILVYVGMAVSNALYHHLTYQLLTMYRGSLASLVYKKTIALRAVSIKESAPVTLMSTDVENIVNSGDAIHDIWASFIEIPVAVYLLSRQVGIVSVFILVPGFITSGAGALISPAMGPARVVWNKAIQERIGSVSNMLSQIKGVKMMGLTDFFHEKLRQMRVHELKLSVRFRWLLVQLNAFAMACEDLTPVIIIIAAIFWTKAGSGLTVAEAFTSISIISIAAQPLTNILISIVQLFGAIGCFTRLQEFLLLEEREEQREMANSRFPSPPSTAGQGTLREEDGKEAGSLAKVQPKDAIVAVSIQGASFVAGENVEVLHDIGIDFQGGGISMVVGRVGCGKSSLLRAIAGELAMKSGRIVSSFSSMAYCDQTPWLENRSIRDNILGQSPLDEKWLATVMEACALDEDVRAFPRRDLTLVGSGGVSLSGGQKQRVALARAVYSRKNLLLLDDVFSGLDNTTSRAVFQRLMGPSGLLRQGRATVILATNHVHFLPAADYITLLHEGKVLRNQVPYDSVDPSEWGILDSDSDSYDSEPEDRKVDKEEEELKAQLSRQEALPDQKTEADLSRQTGDVECYKIYFKSLGPRVLAIFFTAGITHVVMQKMPQIWLRLWTERGTGTKDYGYMGGYIAFALMSTLSGAFCLGSGNRLHEMLLTAVTRAPFYFFTSTDNGITLNRFSQDMNLVDQNLPLSFLNVTILALRALAETGLVASGASYVGLAIVPGALALYLVQKYYLRTSRQMRFLDLEMKTPLYTQFTETLAGLSTIRAFGWSDAFLRDNHARLDVSQKPFYTMFAIQRWLQVVLDLFVAGMALVLVAVALHVPADAASKGSIGLAMVNLIGFNQTLTLVIDMWTRLETSLGAIARLKWFVRNVKPEDREGECEDVEPDWPASGEIELTDVVASDDTENVLKGVSMRVKPGQRVGVCGRSGSGKSSLVLTLARLLELQSGDIKIDGLSLSRIPRQTIRSRLTALPQDAMHLSGTVRHNLDPKGLFSPSSSTGPASGPKTPSLGDDALIAALTKTAIWPAVESRGGLDASLSDLGFSAGQLQLFCLARALLSTSSIVLLDEATSSVDRRTDDEVRRATHDDWKGRTVVEVAHRLELVRDCDVVVVMADGRVQESGPPEELLARPTSAFRALWESQGL